jgi:hypothetical protein
VLEGDRESDLREIRLFRDYEDQGVKLWIRWKNQGNHTHFHWSGAGRNLLHLRLGRNRKVVRGIRLGQVFVVPC